MTDIMVFLSGSASPHSLTVCRSASDRGAVDHGNTRQCRLNMTTTISPNRHPTCS